MPGYHAKFRIGSSEKGYLALVGSNEAPTKSRVKTPDEATIFMSGNDAVISASTELEPGETVEPINRL